MTRKVLTAVLVMMAAWNALEAYAGEPKSEIREIIFRIGGGMNPYDQAYTQLLRQDDGKLTLTLLGDCPNEKISFEVEDSVEARCVSLINEHKLWKAKGYYKPKYEVLDAPTMYFSVTYAEYKGSFGASGDVPQDIIKGISAVNSYLNSLRGNRQATGHFKRTWDDTDILDNQTKWSNGKFTFTPEEEGISELFRYLSEDLGAEYHKYEWKYYSAVGIGIRALIVSNDLLSYRDVFIDTKSANRTSTGGTAPPGLWPKGSRSLLTRNDLSTMSDEDISLMENEIMARHGMTFRDKETQEYFNKQAWYKPADYFTGREFTDVEDQNMRMIESFKR